MWVWELVSTKFLFWALLLVSRFVLTRTLAEHMEIWCSLKSVNSILHLTLLMIMSLLGTECWPTLWDMECWYSWTCDIEWSQWGEEGLVLAEVVLQGLSSNIFPVAHLPSMQKIHLFAFCYQIGLHGEALSLHSISGSSSVEWAEGSLVAQKQPLSWYKVSIYTLIKSKLMKNSIF